MSLDIGGTERHLSLIAPRLRDLGWRPVIFCLWRRGDLATALETAGIEIVGGRATVRPDKRWWCDMHHIALSWAQLIILTLRHRPKVMHFFLPLAYMLGAPISILLRVPVRLMSRRSLNIYQGGHSMIWKIEKRLHASMTAILANSTPVARELIEEEGCPPGKVGIIYSGTDLTAITSEQRPSLDVMGLAPAQFTMITVANLIPYKGHADLLNALSQIASNLPESWRLLCVGRDDGCGQSLHEQALELGLSANVLWLGERDDVPRLLKLADIGVLSSHQEGFSNSVIEGLAAGLPMVVTDVGGNAEAVIDGETGLVVPPRDSAALGRALLQLALDPDARKKMSEAASDRAKNNFSIDGCVNQYDRLYRALIANKTLEAVDGLGFIG